MGTARSSFVTSVTSCETLGSLCFRLRTAANGGVSIERNFKPCIGYDLIFQMHRGWAQREAPPLPLLPPVKLLGLCASDCGQQQTEGFQLKGISNPALAMI